MKNYWPLKVGDEVQVILPAGKFFGIIKEELKNYASTGDTWCRISGDNPRSFLTIARKDNLQLARETHKDKKGD